MAKHDESKDLRSFSRVGKVSIGDKTLRLSKYANVGIKTWGKIDFLTHYCGWMLIWDNNAIGGSLFNVNNEQQSSTRDIKKAKKEHKLSDKTKRNSKKVKA